MRRLERERQEEGAGIHFLSGALRPGGVGGWWVGREERGGCQGKGRDDEGEGCTRGKAVEGESDRKEKCGSGETN